MLLLPEIPTAALGPQARAVAARFRAAYGRSPSYYAMTDYESMSLLLDAIHRAGPTADRDALFQPRDRTSSFGAYDVTAAGDTTLTREAAYRIGRKGTLVFAETLNAID